MLSHGQDKAASRTLLSNALVLSMAKALVSQFNLLSVVSSSAGITWVIGFQHMNIHRTQCGFIEALSQFLWHLTQSNFNNHISIIAISLGKENKNKSNYSVSPWNSLSSREKERERDKKKLVSWCHKWWDKRMTR